MTKLIYSNIKLKNNKIQHFILEVYWIAFINYYDFNKDKENIISAIKLLSEEVKIFLNDLRNKNRKLTKE